MTAIKLIIAADLHLGGPVAAPDHALANLAARARNEALERLVSLARKERASAILLPGDVFHSPEPPLGAVMALERAMGEWLDLGCQVFVAPGNHDPWLPGGVWDKWPAMDGLHIFPPQAGGVALPELGLWVAGVAHDSPQVFRDLSPLLPPPPNGLIGVALLHANLGGSPHAEQHEPHAPASLQALTSAPFALWALGHIHIPEELAQGPLVLYAGTPQGAHLGEPGPRGAWVASLEHGAVSADFVPLAPLTFHDLEFTNLMPLASPAQLVDAVSRQMPPTSPEWPAKRCLRLRLAGPSPLWSLWSREEPQELRKQLAHALGVEGLVLDAQGLCPPLDIDSLVQRPDVLGGLLSLIERLEDDDEFLSQIEAELKNKLHPLTRQQGKKERLAYLRGLAAQARWQGLKDLWQGGAEDDHAA